MNFTLRQLRIFAKIADLQSITKTAEELYLSQPAVSIQLKKFQEQFDIPLTELVSRKIYVTDFGMEIAESARKILAEVDRIEYRSQAFQGALSGRLKLSIVSTAKYVMPYFLSGFMADNPAVDLKMDVTNKRQVVRSLEENEVDFSLVSVVPDQLKLDRVALMPNRLYLVGKPGTTGDTKRTLKWISARRPLLFREPGSATRDAMEQFLAGKDLPLLKKIELTSNEALKQAIVAGIGVSVMPLIGIKNELRNGDLKILEVSGLPVATTWNLVWLSHKRLSPVAEAYLAYVREHKQRLITEEFDWVNQY